MKIILIAGASCSGKTTVARELERHFGSQATVISQDDYYHDLSGLPDEELKSYNFDEPTSVDLQLLAKDLKVLKNGGSVYKKEYSFVEHKRITSKEIIKSTQIVIVEGLFSLYSKEVRKLADITVFVEISQKEAWERRLVRDVAERGMSEAELHAQFFGQVVPMYNQYVKPAKTAANLVVNGNENIKTTVNQILKLLLE